MRQPSRHVLVCAAFLGCGFPAMAQTPERRDEPALFSAPPSVDVLLLGMGGGTYGLGGRIGGGATPWSAGPFVFGGRAMLGVDAGILSDVGQGLVSLHVRSATGLSFGWTRFELGAGLGASYWARVRDDRNTRGVSPSGEASLAWLFGRRGEVGLELRTEVVGLESFGLVLGLRAGGWL
jgi:hypothetical protein